MSADPCLSDPFPADLRLPSIEGLRAFEAAARLGTFERAGEVLSITASAVSKRVSTVEDMLGTPLLSRSGKTLVLTASGKEYLAQVRAALGLLAAVPLHRRAAQRRVRLRVCAPPTFAREILVPALPAFAAAHPGIELEIVLSIPYLEGAGGAEANVEIRHGDAAAHGGAVLMHDRLLPMAAPALLAELGGIACAQDLRTAPLLRTPLEPWANWFRAAGLDDWAEPDRGPRLVDLGLLLEAAAGGQGVALGRPTLARQWLKRGALVMPLALSAPAPTQYFVAPTAAGGAAELFGAWLREVCAGVEREAAELLSRLA